ncbi:MAG TPA: PadR family transcriptional regulator [Ktedonobacteraceae bacterium]|nr:PadR family transcriptional regulator [Ktedonobacteraceae bacterium]
MKQPEAYPITYGVLGLLEYWGPMSGYDLKRMFDHVLAPIWGAVHSQIYHELRRMSTLGWVEMERVEQEARPDRKVYQITQQGREALREWQEQPPAILQMKDELLLKILFGSFTTPETLANNVRLSIRAHEQRLLQYRQTINYLPHKGESYQAAKKPDPYASQGEEDAYFGLVGRFAIEFEKTYLTWLYETLGILEEQQKENEQERQGR